MYVLLAGKTLQNTHRRVDSFLSSSGIRRIPELAAAFLTTSAICERSTSLAPGSCEAKSNSMKTRSSSTLRSRTAPRLTKSRPDSGSVMVERNCLSSSSGITPTHYAFIRWRVK